MAALKCEVGWSTLRSWNTSIWAHVKLGHVVKVLELYSKMQAIDVEPDAITYVGLLKACSKAGSMIQGHIVHEHIIEMAFDSDVLIGTTLIDMYSYLRCLDDACKVFGRLNARNVVSWGALMMGNVKNGNCLRALKLFELMQQECITPNDVILLASLKACATLGMLLLGRLIHDQAVRIGLSSNTTVGNSLIDMYAKCGSLDEALEVFEALTDRDSVSWNVLIVGYLQQGHASDTFALFEKMQKEGFVPEKVTLLGMVKACHTLAAVKEGRLIHDWINRLGLMFDITLGNTLVAMYAKSGFLEDAKKLFADLPTRDVVSWTAMIVGYSHSGHSFTSLELFKQMSQAGVQPNKLTCSSILKACTDSDCAKEGKVVHGLVIESGFESDMVIANSLIDTYAASGSLCDAQKIFNGLQNRDAGSWSAIITGYTQHHDKVSALELIKEMQIDNFKPDKPLFLCILKACDGVNAIRQGRIMHDKIIRNGLEADLMVGNTLIDMYAKCGSLDEAYRVFDQIPQCDAVSWDILIGGHTQHELDRQALELFCNMQSSGIKPDKSTFLSVLKSCGGLGSTVQGRLAHDQIIRRGLESEKEINSVLIDMYAKCGGLDEAHRVFEKLPQRDVVVWGVIIAAYAHDDLQSYALELFKKMQEVGVKPNKTVYTYALKACGAIGALEQGRIFNEELVKCGLASESLIGNSLIDMYARCGSLPEARRVFDELQNRDVVSWCTLIAGYARSADWAPAFQCFEDMKQQSFTADAMMYLNMLAACSRAGRSEEGQGLFKSLQEHVAPHNDFYGYMIELLSRLGLLTGAVDLLQTMPGLPDNVSWTSLLTACRTYNSFSIGRDCFEAPNAGFVNVSSCMLMSNICADTHVHEIPSEMEGLKWGVCGLKKPGKAWIEVKRQVHEFIVGSQDHWQGDELLVKIQRISELIKRDGYIPQVGLSLQQVLLNNDKDFRSEHHKDLAPVHAVEAAAPQLRGDLHVPLHCPSYPDLYNLWESKLDERSLHCVLKSNYGSGHLFSVSMNGILCLLDISGLHMQLNITFCLGIFSIFTFCLENFSVFCKKKIEI